MEDLYSFRDYKDYLNSKLDEMNAGRRGSRAELSRAIGCQTAYTAQVLRGQAHFSLEQIEAVNDFLGHTEDQGLFLLLIHQFNRAGSVKLKARFKKQIDGLLASRKLLKNRLQVDAGLKDSDQVIYYSSWHYAAVHMMAMIPSLQKSEIMADRLEISIAQINEALDFLLISGLLIRKRDGSYRTGLSRLHLGSDSNLISRHHINWRLQSLKAIDKNADAGLHYSSVISISTNDEAHIREKLIETIKQLKSVIVKSSEEKVCSLNIDFFGY